MHSWLNGLFTNRMQRPRLITVAVLFLFFSYLYARGIVSDVLMMGERCNVVLLPFYETSLYFGKVIFLLVIYYYSNAPFMGAEELYSVLRLGKTRWGMKNVTYIFLSAAVLTGILFGCSVLPVTSIGRVANSWDVAIKTISLTGGNAISFGIPYKIIERYNPVTLLMLSFLMNWLIMCFLGLLVYFLSLLINHMVAGIAAATVVFLPYILQNVFPVLIYFSPISWVSCENWGTPGVYGKPDLVYDYMWLLLAILILYKLSEHAIERVDWKSCR